MSTSYFKPSSSYPYLSIARAFGMSYEEVFRRASGVTTSNDEQDPYLSIARAAFRLSVLHARRVFDHARRHGMHDAVARDERGEFDDDCA